MSTPIPFQLPISWLFWIALAMFAIGMIAAVLFVPRLRDKLIPEWRQAWRMDSVRAAAALTALSVIQAEVLPLIEFAVPAQFWPYITGAFGVAMIVLRMRAQPAIHQPRDAA